MLYDVKFVHDNVALDKPGEVAWYVHTAGCEEQEMIFHTKGEAKACGDVWYKDWVDYYRREHGSAESDSPVSMRLYSVRVEVSAVELVEEVEAERERSGRRP